MRAFDKNSSTVFTKTLIATTTEQADMQFEQFENNVPFKKWYYEIELDDFVESLGKIQKEIVKNLDELI